jgi:hypothetical protein
LIPTPSRAGHLRLTLSTLWNLNFSIATISLVWSVSCIALIQVESLLVRLIAIIFANFAIVASSYLIMRSLYRKVAPTWQVVIRDRFIWAALFLTGTCLVLALENIHKYQEHSGWMRIYVVGIFFSMLVGWLFVAIVVIPLRVWSLMQENYTYSLKNTFDYSKENKFSVLLAFAIIIFCWPIFFIYLFLALGFVQAYQVTNFPPVEEASEKYIRETRSDHN